MTETVTIRNGVNVDQLFETIDAVKKDRTAGAFTFKATSIWQDGVQSAGEIGRFIHAGSEDESRDEPYRLSGDEPPVLLGGNKGPNAVELLLQALGVCYVTGYAANAAARGIEIAQLEYDVEGDFDARSFLGLPGPRAGFTEIRVKCRITSPNATQEQLDELQKYVESTSPVGDSLMNPVSVTTALEAF
jgi:uncharacterized OsmC-like protein